MNLVPCCFLVIALFLPVFSFLSFSRLVLGLILFFSEEACEDACVERTREEFSLIRKAYYRWLYHPLLLGVVYHVLLGLVDYALLALCEIWFYVRFFCRVRILARLVDWLRRVTYARVRGLV